jgi:hypothetical protein
MAFANFVGDVGNLIVVGHLFALVFSLAMDVVNDFGPVTMLELPQPLHLRRFPHLLFGVSSVICDRLEKQNGGKHLLCPADVGCPNLNTCVSHLVHHMRMNEVATLEAWLAKSLHVAEVHQVPLPTVVVELLIVLLI